MARLYQIQEEKKKFPCCILKCHPGMSLKCLQICSQQTKVTCFSLLLVLHTAQQVTPANQDSSKMRVNEKRVAPGYLWFIVQNAEKILLIFFKRGKGTSSKGKTQGWACRVACPATTLGPAEGGQLGGAEMHAFSPHSRVYYPLSSELKLSFGGG